MKTKIRKNWLRTFVLCLALFVVAGGYAQPQHGKKGARTDNQAMSPHDYQKALIDFIVKEAELNAQEQATFIPLYKKFGAQKRVVFDKRKNLGRKKPQSEKECREVIQQQDKYDLEIKEIEQQYHNKILEKIPANKVYDILKAEDRFHRKMLKRWSDTPRKHRE
ncbi:MAG: hypothetical protein ACI4BA_06645 [Prevotella sp.]